MHVVAVDAVFEKDGAGVRVHDAPPPAKDDVETVARRVHDRVVRWLRRHRYRGERPVEDRGNEPAETRWNVYAKPPFGGPEQVFRYLGRYTHRVGLSNRRLVSLDDRGVTFRTHGERSVTISPDELLRRFLLHVLPKGFVKIRHHGLLAPGNVSTKLSAARRLLEGTPPTPANDISQPPRDFRDLLLALTGIDLLRCPRCGGTMRAHPLPVEPAVRPTTVPPFDTS